MKELLKSNKKAYLFFRKLKMFLIRKKYRLNNVSHTFYVGGNSKISKDLIALDYSYIGPNCQIGPKVIIGKYTMLANNVSIIGADHIYSNPNKPIIFSGRPKLKLTTIGDDVWVGAFTIIMAGVTVGDGAIIGAGSVITKDILPYTVCAGVPAKFLKMRFNDEEINKHKMMLSKGSTETLYCEDKI